MIIAIVDHKGGVGKTTTATAISQAIDARRRPKGKALLIDTDPQGSATKTVYGISEKVPGLYEVMKGNIKPSDAIQCTQAGDILPYSRELSLMDAELSNKEDFISLKKIIDQLKGQYTHIIIDTAPGLGTMTAEALNASEAVIIPTGATPEAVESLKLTYKTVDIIRSHNHLKILGAVITQYDGRANITRQYEELIGKLCDSLDIPLLKTRVRRCIAIQEAHALRENLITYAPRSNATADYMNVIKELKILK